MHTIPRRPLRRFKKIALNCLKCENTRSICYVYIYLHTLNSCDTQCRGYWATCNVLLTFKLFRKLQGI